MTLVYSPTSGPVASVLDIETLQGPVRSQVVDVAALGPTGPAGPPGATGATGPIGPTGPSGGGAAGALSESFSGGVIGPVTATSGTAQIGDYGWNLLAQGALTGASVARIPGEAGAVGLWRITSSNVLSSGPSLYLGSATAGQGIIQLTGMSSATWRARSAVVAILNQLNSWGIADAPTPSTRLQFAEWLTRSASGNFQTRTGGTGGSGFGLPNIKDTGVAVDAAIHTFQIVRVSSLQYDFYIDGVLRTQHIDNGTITGDAMPTGPMTPFAYSLGSAGATTNMDVDNFSFAPL